MVKGIFKGILMFAAVALTVIGLGTCGVFGEDFSSLSGWAERDVREARELGILPESMISDFKAEMTRDEFCYFCVSVMSKWYDCGFSEVKDIPELAEIAENSDFQGFSDTDAWYVRFCAELGIISGVGNGLFAPNSSITREQAARMLYNTLDIATPVTDDYKADNKNGVNGIFLPHIFADGRDIESWAKNEVYAMYHLGVMMGDTNNNFNPKAAYTEEQGVCTFLRLYKAYASPDEVKKPDPEIYPAAENSYVFNGTGYRLDAAYQWGSAEYTYEPLFYDGFGNVYTAREKGYVYPIGEKYMEVLTAAGAGVSRSIIINKDGREVTDGFSNIFSIDGDTAIAFDYGDMYICNLLTGEKQKTTSEIPTENIGCDIFAFYKDGCKGYLNSLGEVVFPAVYKPISQTFLNNYCVLQKQDNSFIIVNTSGETLKTFKLDLNKYDVDRIYGTNMILLKKDGSGCILYRAYSEEIIDGYTYMSFTENGDIIADKRLLNKSGEIIADVKELGYDDIQQTGGGYYILSHIDESSWSRISPFAIMNENGKIIKAGMSSNDIKISSEGLIAYKSSINEIIVFDSKGKDIGTIKTEMQISDFRFLNGIVNVISMENESTKAAYYTPEGEPAVKQAWSE